MTQINLLPWRQQIKQEMYTRYAVHLAIYLLAIAALTLIINIIFYAVTYYQESKNNYIRRELGIENKRLISLTKDIKSYETMTSNLQFLYSLKQTSYEAVKQLDALAIIVPKSVVLDKIERNGSSITLTGSANSNFAITELMKNISASGVFNRPDLSQINIENTGTENSKRFILKMTTVTGKK